MIGAVQAYALGVISPPSYAQTPCGSGICEEHAEVSSLMQCLGSLPKTLGRDYQLQHLHMASL